MEDFHIKNRVSGKNRYYIDENLVLWGYGFNDYGQLGIGTVDSLDTFYTEPIRIAENVVSVDASINGYFCIYLTEEGRNMAERVREICDVVDDTGWRGISKEERDDFCRIFEKIIQNLEEGEEKSYGTKTS